MSTTSVATISWPTLPSYQTFMLRQKNYQILKEALMF